MKRNGFTLIELLAVIVILAIIALIATPIILGIINDSKEEGVKRSAENYVDAVELAIANKNLEEEFNPSMCEIQTDGNLDCEGTALTVEVDGTKPSKGWLSIDNGKIKQYSMFVDNNTVTKTEEGTELVSGDNVTEIPGSETSEVNHLARENVTAATQATKTTGVVPSTDASGNIVPGSEFKIKVNDTIGEVTFFVLSNNGNYVNLIAQQNITSTGAFTSEPQNNDEWKNYAGSSPYNTYGPQTAYTYLSGATSNWTNVPIIESFTYEDEGHKQNSTYGYQSIVTALDSTTGKYITTINLHSSVTSTTPVTYENMRARLPYVSEITSNTSCKLSSDEYIDFGSCPLWMVNYLSNNSNYLTTNGKVDSTSNNFGYWTLSSDSSSNSNARYVNYNGYLFYTSNSSTYMGIRPVITVLKSDLTRVM